MTQTLFLTIAGAVGLLIGPLAYLRPGVVLAGKGVVADPAPAVWVREVGEPLRDRPSKHIGRRDHSDSANLPAAAV